MTEILEKTHRTRLRRAHQRGHYDRDTIYGILDAQPLCHLGYIQDGGPVVMPSVQWREGGYVYWHASSAGRGVNALLNGDVCLTVSLLDGYVLARSAMHHSLNYRSVMIFGRPTLVEDPDTKKARLGGLIDTLFPGRNATLRPMTDQELKATAVFALPIEEASAKIRSGGPVDDMADLDLPIWAGVVPVSQTKGTPERDAHTLDHIEVPSYTKD